MWFWSRATRPCYLLWQLNHINPHTESAKTQHLQLKKPHTNFVNRRHPTHPPQTSYLHQKGCTAKKYK
jgi:hypothetical protein